jgi:two-component system chemotaxis response regulator CheY
MSELVVLVIEDEPEVRAAVVRDLRRHFEQIRIDEAEDADDAIDALAEAADAGDHVGLILADHRLPGRSGVDVLVALHDDPGTRAIRKVLITGQASHADTIRAVNDAGLDHYIAKPWDPDDLIAIAVDQLTDYVIDEGLDPLAFMRELDAPRLAQAYGASAHPD